MGDTYYKKHFNEYFLSEDHPQTCFDIIETRANM